jgi:FdhD protein
MSADAIERRTMLRVRDGRAADAEDWVVVEEPLEIRLEGEPLAVIMRTPGHDLELAAGFAFTEGIIRSAEDLGVLRQCRSGEADDLNVVEMRLVGGTLLDRGRLRRALVTSSACGLCGKASLEALEIHARPVASAVRVRRDILSILPDRLIEAQTGFGRTGALHASGLFAPDGVLRICREDVGRHNAVDKVLGRCLFDQATLDDSILLVSGRTSFEILQKAAMAGIPIVAAISGPTTLAIETARTFNITLVNFLRGRNMNVASCPERLIV